MTAGAFPVRMRQSSSWNCTSRVRCRPFSPPAAHQAQQGLRNQEPARDVVAHGTLLVAPGTVALRLHADQAAEAGPLFGVGHPLAEARTARHRAAAPLAAAAVALDGLAAVPGLRIEIRRCWTTGDPDLFAHVDPDREWRDLASLVWVESEHRCGDRVLTEVRCFISSLSNNRGGAQALDHRERPPLCLGRGLRRGRQPCQRRSILDTEHSCCCARTSP